MQIELQGEEVVNLLLQHPDPIVVGAVENTILYLQNQKLIARLESIAPVEAGDEIVPITGENDAGV